MRHDPAAAAIVIMLRSLKMYGMAQAVEDLIEQGAPAFEATIPILSQLLKAELAEREVRSIAYHMKAARFPAYSIRPVRAAGGSAVTVALHGDHLAKVFNAEWGEGQDFDFFGAIDPDHPVFGFHADGEIMKVIDSFAEVRSDAVDGLDGMDLVQLHGQAASAMC